MNVPTQTALGQPILRGSVASLVRYTGSKDLLSAVLENLPG